MRTKSKNTAVRIGLVGLLVLLATAPLTYPYFASTFGIKLGRTATALDFTSASENAPSPDILMAYAGIASKRAAEGNYSEAKRLLGMTKLPVNVEHNLITYLALMHELVLTLDSLKPKLERLRP